MASEIKMGISLDSSGVRKGLAKAKSSVKNFTSEATASLKTFTRVGVAGLAAGFSVAARKSFSYAKEVENLSRISNTSVEDFQRNAHAAQTVGIEQEKLADIYKDTGDKIGDFLQTGGGPMADYFENIAPLVGQTAEQFRELSGPDALQLYFDGLEKANLSQNDMTFYMEAIASDATALIPLLAKSGQGFQDLGKDATVMGDNTVKQLARAEKALDSFKTKVVVFAGTRIGDLMSVFSQTEGQKSAKAGAQDVGARRMAAVGQLQADGVKFSKADLAILNSAESTITQITSVMESRGKTAQDFFKAQQKQSDLIKEEENKIADAAKKEQQAQAAKIEKQKKQAKLTNEIGEAEKRLAKLQKESADSERSKEAELFDLKGKREKLEATISKEAKDGSQEYLEAVKAKEELLEVNKEIESVEGDIIKANKEAAKQTENDQKRASDKLKEAEEKAKADAQREKEKAELKKDQSLRKELLEAQINQRDGLAHAIQEEITLKQRAKQIQQEIGGEYERALELAKEILKVEAGPDANRSGFVTRKEQRAFDKAQKVRAKEQKKRQREEIRNEIKNKQNMTARERAKAAADDRKRRRNEAEDKRNDAKKKDQLEKEKEAGDEVKKNQDAMKKAAKDVLKKREDMKPKKPENAIIDKFIPKLNRQIELLEAINKSLECEG